MQNCACILGRGAEDCQEGANSYSMHCLHIRAVLIILLHHNFPEILDSRITGDKKCANKKEPRLKIISEGSGTQSTSVLKCLILFCRS